MERTRLILFDTKMKLIECLFLSSRKVAFHLSVTERSISLPEMKKNESLRFADQSNGISKHINKL